MKKTILFLAASLAIQGVHAQHGMILYNMVDLPQRNQLNPALPYVGQGAVSIPFISSPHVALGNTAFAYSDFIRHDGDSLYMDPENIIRKMKDDNLLHAAAGTNLFGFSLRIGPGSFSFEIREKAYLFMSYSREMMEFLWKGNASSLGERTEIDPGLDFTHRRDYALGYALKLNETVQLGARARYIYGMENITVDKAYATLETDPHTFALTSTTSVDVHTSGIESNTFDDFSMEEYAFGRKNTGWGIDLGAQVVVAPGLAVSASVLDLGSITWRSHTDHYSGRNTDNEFTYAGLDLEAFFADTSGASEVFEDILDTLESAFDIVQSNESYSSGLPTHVYLGGTYMPDVNQSFHVLAHAVRFNDKTYTDLSVSYCRRLGRWLSISPGVTLLQGGVNVGLGAVLSLNSFQFYLVSDNIHGVFLPLHARHIDARAGINFVIGRKK